MYILTTIHILTPITYVHREQKTKLDKEFGDMLGKIGNRKDMLYDLEKKLSHIDKARQVRIRCMCLYLCMCACVCEYVYVGITRYDMHAVCPGGEALSHRQGKAGV